MMDNTNPRTNVPSSISEALTHSTDLVTVALPPTELTDYTHYNVPKEHFCMSRKPVHVMNPQLPYFFPSFALIPSMVEIPSHHIAVPSNIAESPGAMVFPVLPLRNNLSLPECTQLSNPINSLSQNTTQLSYFSRTDELTSSKTEGPSSEAQMKNIDAEFDEMHNNFMIDSLRDLAEKWPKFINDYQKEKILEHIENHEELTSFKLKQFKIEDNKHIELRNILMNSRIMLKTKETNFLWRRVENLEDSQVAQLELLASLPEVGNEKIIQTAKELQIPVKLVSFFVENYHNQLAGTSGNQSGQEQSSSARK